MNLHANAKLGLAWSRCSCARDRGWAFAEGGRDCLQRFAGDGASLVASLARGRPQPRLAGRSLKSAAPLAAAAELAGGGADPAGAAADGPWAGSAGRDRAYGPLDDLEGAAPARRSRGGRACQLQPPPPLRVVTIGRPAPHRRQASSVASNVLAIESPAIAKAPLNRNVGYDYLHCVDRRPLPLRLRRAAPTTRTPRPPRACSSGHSRISPNSASPHPRR